MAHWQPFISGMLTCFGRYLLYLITFICVLLLIRRLFRVPQAVWRKLLHLVAYTSSLFMMAVSDDWRIPTTVCVLFAAIVYPILSAAESHPLYSTLFVQKKAGEIKKSLLLLFLSHAFLIAVCWGALGKPYIAVVSIVVWGTGDMAAAWVGKWLGRHHVHLPLADSAKTWEGSAAMAVTGTFFACIILRIATPFSPLRIAFTSVLLALVAAYTELISHDGNDTVTVPLACAAVMILLSA